MMSGFRKATFMLAALVQGGFAFAESATPNMANLPLPAVLGGWPTPQKIEGVPEFHPHTLKLENVPKATGPREALFNGKDLSQFTPWLGYAHGGMFPKTPNDKPLGETGIGDVFRVVQEDGVPAIYITGKVWGSINTRRELGNYHLSLWYKFGKQWNPSIPANSGVLYHSYGPYGAFAGSWMSSLEFEVMPRLTGMLAEVGRELNMQIPIGEGSEAGVYSGARDFRFMPGGKQTEIRMPTPIKQHSDAERPFGQWNKLDLYVAGDRAVHVVNDVPVMAISHIALRGNDGALRALTKGRIQLQSEGTEVYMREVWIEPIRSVPKVVATD
jgi:hypothetical protein